MFNRYFIFLLWCLSANVAQATLMAETKLDNGMRIIVKPDHRAPIIISQIWYQVGSGDEQKGKTGIAHMLEHMMFKSTSQYKTGEFSRLIAEAGGMNHAATTRDYTVYYQKLSSAQLSLCLRLEADRMQHLIIKAEELKSENEVVKEERRLRTDDNPQALFLEKFSRILFKNMSYEHGPIGWMNEIKKLTAADLQQWYKSYYSPNNAILVVVGDVDPQQVFAEARKYFGDIAPQKLLPRPMLSTQFVGPERIEEKLPAKWPWFVLGYTVPSLATASTPTDAYALAVLAAILDGGNSSRFSKELIRRQSIASQASADYDFFSRLGSIFFISATPVKAENMAKLETMVLTEIEKLKKELVSPEELNRAKTKLIADFTYAQDDIEEQANIVGEMAVLNIPLTNEQQYVNHIKAVTPAQLQNVAKKYLSPEHQLIGVLLPSGNSSLDPVNNDVPAFQSNMH